MRDGRAGFTVAAIVATACWGGAALAQDGAASSDDMRDVFERIEQRDKEARQDGIVLDNIPVRQPENDPIRKSMKLSIGELGNSRAVSPFDDRPSPYLRDPIAPPDAPPFGLNLKLKF